MAISLGLVAMLLVVGLNAFSGSGAAGAGASGEAKTSILSQSSAETQNKLGADGRDSSYGDPPTPAQQAQCTDELAGQIAG